MSEVIKKSDVSEKDIYEYVRLSAEKAEVQITKINNSLRDSARLNNELLKKSKGFGSAQEIKEVELAIKNSNLAYSQKLKLEKEQLANQKLLEKARLEDIRLEKAREKNIDNFNKKLADQNNAYKKLSNTARDLKNESKRLGAELLHLEQTGKKNTKEFALIERQYKETTAQAIVLDQKLKKLDSTVGDNFRNVGNYSSATDKLRSAFNRLGISIGIGMVVRGAGKSLVDFEENSANIAKTLGVTTERAKELSTELLKIDSRSSVEELQKIATIGGQLGISENDIIGFTTAVDKLNVALGDEFTGGADEITTVIGGLRNVFSDIKTDNVEDDLLGIGNALNALGASGSATAPIVSDFAGRIGGVGIPLGLTTGQVLGLSATLQELQVNSERGGTAVTKILQKMTTNTAEFAKLAGIPLKEFEQMVNTDLFGAFNKVVDGTKKSGKNATELGRILDKLGVDGAGASEVFLKLSSNTELLTKNTKLSTDALKEQDSITAEFNVKNNTLGATIEKLTKEFQKYVIGLDDAGNVSGKLGSFLNFVIHNFQTITSVLGKFILALITYKTVMKAIDLNGQFQNWRKVQGAITETATATTEAGKGVVGFGNALKGVGWTVAIGLAFELTTQMWDLFSGTKKAREEYQRYKNSLSQGEKLGQESVQRIKDKFDVESKSLELQLAKGEITEKQYKSELKALNTLIDAQIIGEIRLANEMKAIAEKKGYKHVIAKENAILKELIGLQKERKKASVDALIAELNEGKATEKNTKKIQVKTKALEEQKKAYKDVTDEIIKQFQLEDKIEEEVDVFKIKDVQSQLEDEIKLTEDYGVVRSEKIDELLKEEENLRKEQIKKMPISEQEKNLLLIDLEDEMAKKRVEIYKDLNEKQEDFSDKRLKKEEENIKKTFETFKDGFDAITDYGIKKSDERIAQIDKEISAAEKQADVLQELAKNGNITAQQSLSEQQKIINEANKNKIKEQKRIEFIKTLQVGLDVYSQKVNKGDKNPVASTLFEIKLLTQLLKAIPGFYKGTENAPEGWAFTQEKGREIITDAMGNVKSLGSDDGPELTYLKKGDKVLKNDVTEMAMKYNSGIVHLRKRDDAGNTFDIAPLISEVRDLKKAIENKPETNIEMGRITGSILEVVKSTKQGSTIRNDRFIHRR